MLTKKHFNTISQIITENSIGNFTHRRALALSLARYFKQLNSNFNTEVFLHACQYYTLKEESTMINKAEAKLNFEEYILPLVKSRFGADDRIAIRESWSNYIDSLYQDEMITERQLNTWSNPY